MNTPKEIATELVDKFIEASVVIDDEDNHHHPRPYSLAKQCAIIHCEGVIEVLEDAKEYVDDNQLFHFNNNLLKHWQQVIQEINIL